MEHIIGLGDYYISQDIGDVLKIYGLSSCIGLVLYSPKIKLLGVAHILLPVSSINPELSKISPAYFADTGVSCLANQFYFDYGCKPEDILVSIFGGAESISKKDIFNIGARNCEAVKAKLAEYGLVVHEAQVGGRFSRTIEAEVSTGAVRVEVHKMCL